jgi:1-acyl-sn-glycerol-3-phosphate acyltransferase
VCACARVCLRLRALGTLAMARTWVAWAVRAFLSLLLRLFFRETGRCNGHKIPTDAAVIFVCAPHANQASSKSERVCV